MASTAFEDGVASRPVTVAIVVALLATVLVAGDGPAVVPTRPPLADETVSVANAGPAPAVRPGSVSADSAAAPTGEPPIISTVDTGYSTGHYASVAVTADGRPVVAYYDDFHGAARIATCDDVACTSSTRQTIADEGATGLFTTLALDAGGLARIAFRDQDAGALVHVRCHDRACAELTSNVIDASGGLTGTDATIAIASDGAAVVAYRGATGDTLEIARCADAVCGTVRRVTVDTAEGAGEFASLALDDHDRPVVAYRAGEDGALRLLRCSDRDCTGTDIATLVAGRSGIHASLALDGALPVVAFRDAGVDGLRLARCGDPACGSVTFTTLDDEGDTGYFASLELRDGRPRVSYYDETTRSLRLVRCDDPACTAPVRSVLDDLGMTGVHADLALDRDGRAVVAYHDLTSRTLRLARCTTTACGLPAAGADGLTTALAVGPGGGPVALYQDPKGAGLVLAVCPDPACPDAVGTTLSDQPTGAFADVAVHGGHAVASFHEERTGALVVARCELRDCVSTLTTTTVSGEGDTGLFPAVAVRADGRPVIAFRDRTNRRLAVALCDDPACSTAAIRTLAVTGPYGGSLDLSLSSGLPVVAYVDEGAHGVAVARCRDAGCHDVDTEALPPVGAVASVTVTPHGDRGTAVAYDAPSSGSSWVSICDDDGCTTPASVGDGRAPQVVSTGDGLAAALVDHAGRGWLVRCADRSCARSRRTPVEGDRFAGQSAAAVALPDGQIAVAFRDGPSDELRITACDDGACGAPGGASGTPPRVRSGAAGRGIG